MPDYASAYRNLPVVVLGGTGFIGRWVARALSQCGADLLLAVRDRNAAEMLCESYGIEAAVAEVDVEANPQALQAVIADFNPAVVFNLMGYGIDRSERDQQPAYTINAELPQRLCEWLAASESAWQGLRLVHVGSALEYGELENDLHEDSEPQPTTLYGQSKLAGTLAVSQFCAAHDFRAITARLFTVYGYGEHAGRLLPALIDAASKGESLPMTAGLQQRDFCFVQDVAEGLLRLAVTTCGSESVVNLATGELNTVRRFVELAAAELDINAGQLQFGALPVRAEEMAHQPVNVQRLQQCLGWLPSADLQAGIQRSLACEPAPGRSVS